MPRYIALLRGVSPMNAKMPELKACFEAAGFTEVRTLLSSGNVVFNARSAAPDALARRAEKAMQAALGTSFDTIVRPADAIRQRFVDVDAFAAFTVPAGAKRIVTFLRQAPADPAQLPALPIEREGASILALDGQEVLSYYVPSPQGPVFMNLLERTFGKAITTRTLDTVRKCATA